MIWPEATWPKLRMLAGKDAAGNRERARTDAVAFDVADAVERGGAVGGSSLGEEGSGDVSVGERQKLHTECT